MSSADWILFSLLCLACAPTATTVVAPERSTPLASASGVASAPRAPAGLTPSGSSSVTPAPSSGPPVSPVATVGAGQPAEPAAAALQFLDQEGGRYRETPPEVARELEHFRSTYPPLPALERLPDFLSLNAVLKLHPDAESEGLRERIRAQLAAPVADAADAAWAPLRGATLDDDERLTALWVQGSLSQVLATYDGDRLVGRAIVTRGQPFLGEVLTESDGARREVLVRSITSMSVCCHPESLLVFRVGKRGALSKVLSFELGHSEVGPGVRWDFLNRFEFDPPARRVVVRRVFPEAGAYWELLFDQRLNEYRKVSSSAASPNGPPRSRKRATEL